MEDKNKQAQPVMTYEQLQARVRELEANSNKQLATTGDGIVFKVKTGEGSKGTISAFGLGRFPVSLYASQWKTLASVLLANDGAIIRKAIAMNADALSFKDDAGSGNSKAEILAWANATPSK